MGIKKALPTEIAVALLPDHGASIEAESDYIGTPLHFAVGAANPEMVALLPDHGASIEAEDDRSATPLHFAVAAANPEMVALLLERGANIEAESYYIGTSCQLAQEREDFKGTPVLDLLCAP